MLSDIRRDDRIPIPGQFIQPLDHLLRLDRSILLLVIRQGMGLLPFLNLIPPGLAKLFLLPIDRCAQDLIELTKHSLTVAHNRNIDIDVFPNRGRVNIDMNHFCIGTELRHLPRHPIVKPCADGNHQIGIMHGHVRLIGPVHPKHPEG